MNGCREGVVVSAPNPWVEALVAGGARIAPDRSGWGPAFKFGDGGPLLLVEVEAPAFRQLAYKVSLLGRSDAPTLFAAGPDGWEPLDVAGRSTEDIIDTLVDRLHSRGAGTTS